MSIYISTKPFRGFLDSAEGRRYRTFLENNLELKDKAESVYAWLQMRVDMLMASIINHEKPAIQGVLYELELFMKQKFGWTSESREFRSDEASKIGFFITMIGAMVKHIVAEFGFTSNRSGIALRHSSRPRGEKGLLRTASDYCRSA